MKPPKPVFVCQECGAQAPKWLGRCPECGAWNSLRRGARGAGRRRRRGGALPRSPRAARGARLYADVADVGGGAHVDRHRRIRPRARRRHRARLARAARRRARHRQVHAAAAGGGPRGARRRARCSTARARSPSTRSSRAASACGVGQTRRCTCSPRRVSSAILEEVVALTPVARRRRLDSDRVLAEDAVGARQHRPGARGGHRSCCSRPRGRTSRSCSSGTSPRTGVSPAPRRSNTLWTRCCISKASGITPTASCGRSRIASAPPASSASSR